MSDYEKLVATAEQCGLKIISDHFCCTLLAWVYMFGAEPEIVTYNVKLRTDISSAQKRLNIFLQCIQALIIGRHSQLKNTIQIN